MTKWPQNLPPLFNVEDCDLIVCWENDWPECPIEIIELKEIIKTAESLNESGIYVSA